MLCKRCTDEWHEKCVDLVAVGKQRAFICSGCATILRERETNALPALATRRLVEVDRVRGQCVSIDLEVPLAVDVGLDVTEPLQVFAAPHTVGSLAVRTRARQLLKDALAAQSVSYLPVVDDPRFNAYLHKFVVTPAGAGDRQLIQRMAPHWAVGDALICEVVQNTAGKNNFSVATTVEVLEGTLLCLYTGVPVSLSEAVDSESLYMFNVVDDMARSDSDTSGRAWCWFGCSVCRRRRTRRRT